MPGAASPEVEYWAKAPSRGSRVVHAWWNDAIVCKPGLDLPVPTQRTFKWQHPPHRACRVCLDRLGVSGPAVE